jgi:hypothetical protein
MSEVKEKFRDLIENQNLLIDGSPFVVKNFLKNVEDYLNWNTLNEAINNDIVEWELIDKNTKQKLPIPYNKPLWVGIRQQDRQFISEQVNNGITFVISRCCILNDNFKSLVSDIQKTFPVACDIHIYGSKGNSSSFEPHSDRPNNFIIQAAGDTDWIVFKNKISSILPFNHYKLEKEVLTPELEVTLSPGDLLYIPPKTYHVALPSMPRLSMSIPCTLLDNFFDLPEQLINRLPVDVNKYEI